MKLSNIFKNENLTNVKSKVEKLEKNQLNTVVGGAEAATDPIVSPLDPGDIQDGKTRGKIIKSGDSGTLSA
jgi:hypothetical protein